MGKPLLTKKMVGASVPKAVQAGIDEWLRKYPLKNQTMFIIESYREKIQRDTGIKITDEEAFIDGRVRKPNSTSGPVRLEIQKKRNRPDP